MKEEILQINELKIPYIIKNYKRSKTIRIIFKQDKLLITKPTYIPKKMAYDFIKQKEDTIYRNYKKIVEENADKKPSWSDGQKILYKGQEFLIKVNYYDKNSSDNQLKLFINQEKKLFEINMPYVCKQDEAKYVKEVILELFKRNTEIVLKEKVDFWSEKTNIKYDSYKVRDARTRYGSCEINTKKLHFSSRLIMIKDEAIDAVVVHELCHIVHGNHGKDFYELVNKYISNYKELDKYLKDCSKYIRM